mmetsp:Transcript_37061/g.44277  ORF Transcript_37061/g.44277 Transcript_37061/m.44277 type:complete len:81 (+) Transcript_37061:829-1071(+)
MYGVCRFVKRCGGLEARAFQHELDHLDGILLLDHAGLEELPRAIASLEMPFHGERQRRAFERRTYQVMGRYTNIHCCDYS